MLPLNFGTSHGRNANAKEKAWYEKKRFHLLCPDDCQSNRTLQDRTTKPLRQRRQVTKGLGRRGAWIRTGGLLTGCAPEMGWLVQAPRSPRANAKGNSV